MLSESLRQVQARIEHNIDVLQARGVGDNRIKQYLAAEVAMMRSVRIALAVAIFACGLPYVFQFALGESLDHLPDVFVVAMNYGAPVMGVLGLAMAGLFRWDKQRAELYLAHVRLTQPGLRWPAEWHPERERMS